MAQDSGFDTFPADYDRVNYIDNPTWEKRKVYDDRPYLVLPNFKFNVKLGNTLPTFKCFIKKGGGQFGEPITLPNLSDYTITLKVYDYSNSLIFFGPMTISNIDLGEISYDIQPLDFVKGGIYYCEVEFKREDNKSFSLPDTHFKYEIIVKD